MSSKWTCIECGSSESQAYLPTHCEGCLRKRLREIDKKMKAQDVEDAVRRQAGRDTAYARGLRDGLDAATAEVLSHSGCGTCANAIRDLMEE